MVVAAAASVRLDANRQRVALLVCCALLAGACGAPLPGPDSATTMAESASSADIVFTNAVVYTQDPDFGKVEAIAVTGDRITDVGAVQEMSTYIGPDTNVIDLDGGTVIPGFVDAHTHILTDTGSVSVGQPQALEVGITTVAEAFVDRERLDTLREAGDSGELRLRTSLYLIRTDNCGSDQGRWYEEYAPGELLSERVRVAGVKVFADGGTCGPFAISEPYRDGVEVGAPFATQEVMNAYVEDADRAGYQLLVHAIGDLAIAQVMDAYLEVLGPGGAARLNHRIDHNIFQTPSISGRYDELGVSVALFGWLDTCRLESDFTDFWYDYADDPSIPIEQNPNTVFGWHGDDPWVGPVNPLREIFSLETRAEPRDGEICQPDDRVAKKTIPRQKAFDMMTTGSSFLLNQSRLVGSLTPGKSADIVILSDDLMTVEPERLLEIQVEMTMIGGIAEYCVSEFCKDLVAP